MAKKGKEIELGSIRIQIDPFILIQRVLMRQKLTLVIVAVLGGIITIVQYKRQPKIYASYGQISVRTENMDADFARKFVNRGMKTLHSKEEISLIINELDLFSGTRASMPYSIAIRNMRRELKIKNSQGTIEVIYESKDPKLAHRVVAFVVERVLSNFERLLYEPFDRQISALNRAIAELMPNVEAARKKLFEFKAKYPSIAVRNPDFVPTESPKSGIEKEIKQAEATLRGCYAGLRPAPAKVKMGPACRALRGLKADRDAALNQFTANHPTVVSLDSQIKAATPACTREREASGAPITKKMNKAECIAAANKRIKALHERRLAAVTKGIKRPKLMQEWLEISSQAAQYESQIRALKEKKAKTFEDRVMGSSNFTDNFSLVDAPRVPDIPVKPHRNQFLMTGIAITAIIGILIALAREALRQKFLDPKEFEEQTGLDVLAVLPDITE